MADGPAGLYTRAVVAARCVPCTAIVAVQAMSGPLGSVSHYELQRPLGSGGMGEVYLAHDTRLNRPVAIKFLRGAGSDDAEVQRRLLREARAAAALDHPNICAIYEVGTDDGGRPFIAMQYVEGETLATRLHRGRLPRREALALATGIAEALDAAHRRGIVHRDLKPQNIMVTASGTPKLLDFGIAKVQRPLEAVSGTTTTHVESGAVAGTPGYMAPEVLQGRSADARSDLFSLGVVLYECLTGRQPFRGVTPQEVWGQVLHVVPARPSESNDGLDPGVDELCRRLLAKDPADRMPSASQALGALQLLTARGEPPLDDRRTRVWWTAGVAIAAMLAATLAGVTWWQASDALAEPPPDAVTWYTRGIDAVRQGAYATGRRALGEAVRIFPEYALAHSRLAEAQAELDEERAAQASLIRVGALVPDQSRLGAEDRLRLDAIRATVLRDFDRAIAAHADLSRRRSGDAGALVDLGRAQESAGRLVDARQTYERATALDPQFAAGFLRLGGISGSMGATDQAVRAFDEAERLYTIASNTEGQVETMLRRGAVLDAAGRFDEALTLAERSARVAGESALLAQQVRAGFLAGSALVGAGRFAEAEGAVRTNVDHALAAGLQGVAADGLIDMAGALFVSGRLDEADQALVRARAIADERSLLRTAMRAATQRSALKLQQDEPREALTLLAAPLKYFAETRHQRLEAVALTIGSRAHENLGELAEARRMAQRVFEFASASGNDEITAQALTSLANLAEAEGNLPQSADHHLAAVDRLRGLGDSETLPFSLTSLTEILIRLGRRPEAGAAFAELDAGIAKGAGAFPTRVRRVAYLRALAALVDGRFADARRSALDAERAAPGRTDQTGQLARATLGVADAHLGTRGPLPEVRPGVDPTSSSGMKIRLWRSEALLARGDAERAGVEAVAVQKESARLGGEEFSWRAAAVAARAAARRGDGSAPVLAAQALRSLGALGREWGSDQSSLYQARFDVFEAMQELRRIAGTTRP